MDKLAFDLPSLVVKVRHTSVAAPLWNFHRLQLLADWVGFPLGYGIVVKKITEFSVICL